MRRFLSVLLVGLVSYVAAAWWLDRPRPPSGPRLGAPLPSVNIAEFGQSQQVRTLGAFLTEQKAACSVVVFVTTSCPVCLRMRFAWTARAQAWADSLDYEPVLAWLTAEDSSRVEEFYRGFRMAPVRQLLVVGEQELAAERLGIFGTPTLYLLDRNGNLRFGIVGDNFPPADSARAACDVS